MRQKRWQNQYIALLESMPELILRCPEGLPAPFEAEFLTQKLNRFEKVIAELGCGSGGHLVAQAKLNPMALFLGFELRSTRTFRSAEKAKDENLDNLIFLRCDARRIAEVLSEDSLSGIYINFPDPWADRRKWAKHKLLKGSFLSLLCSMLRPGGFISYKTDHAPSFADTHALIKENPLLSITKLSQNLHHSEYLQGNVFSEFERLFHSKGFPVFFIEAAKTT
ncbi:MAG: tRNA (guanosine(46)-N7)-methyltransferase TrmB [Deltaproteobacteria bacterium]|nr:tRNA (guanosine(46)-N7)-methyltransferase TrmB [Deltaproteobacteria bacterium]